ncbi:hypothetical protein GGI15_003858 [Coemansia interrupta]|uniref:DUF4097 domain-containing protein n=1 Tax=Coemansia interrupta TaxID=1126814 RepID=A0A9W8HAC2_9FUNG|nr:hypothetical protein GGI15_003858 [Coemansia interrupta]
MMVSDIQFVQDEHADTGELPPPYTEYDHQVFESPRTLHSTDMSTSHKDGIIVAHQLLQPKQTGIKIAFDGFCKTIFTIRPDIDGKYQGLILKLFELVVRMPSNSQLVIRDIMTGTLGRLDVAVIQGSADIRSVSINSMRVAMGDGAICARNIYATKDAEFVSICGTIELRDCSAAKTLGTKTKSADIYIHRAKASQVNIEGSTRPTQARFIEAESLQVRSNSGDVTVECDVADLKIQTRSGSIHGTWNVSRSLDLYAASAIINGDCRILGDCVRASVMSRDWPISLNIDQKYAGHYDVKAQNSVARFDLPRGTRYEDHPHWCQGVIGVSGNTLNVEGVNAPVVVSSSAL